MEECSAPDGNAEISRSWDQGSRTGCGMHPGPGAYRGSERPVNDYRSSDSASCGC